MQLQLAITEQEQELHELQLHSTLLLQLQQLSDVQLQPELDRLASAPSPAPLPAMQSAYSQRDERARSRSSHGRDSNCRRGSSASSGMEARGQRQ